jgi:hypothetical protein
MLTTDRAEQLQMQLTVAISALRRICRELHAAGETASADRILDGIQTLLPVSDALSPPKPSSDQKG